MRGDCKSRRTLPSTQFGTVEQCLHGLVESDVGSSLDGHQHLIGHWFKALLFGLACHNSQQAQEHRYTTQYSHVIKGETETDYRFHDTS